MSTFRLPVYLDCNATTPADPAVIEAMQPYWQEQFGNPASRSHAYGREAEQAVERARGQVAELIGARPAEIVFTSGATESDNLALSGVVAMYAGKGNHVITGASEHQAVLDTCRALGEQGCEVTILQPDENGRIQPDQVAGAITDRTVLVSLMAANNVTGVTHPIRAIGEVTSKAGVLFHSDAVQAIGRLDVDVEALKIDLLSMSGHKIYGPKGIGALYVRRRHPRVRLQPQMHGGGHERGLRSGTLNVPGIVGLGKACRLIGERFPEEPRRLGELRDRLEVGILDGVDRVKRNGDSTHRLVNTSNLTFGGVDGEALMKRMANLAVSSGSACSSESGDRGSVLQAMGVSERMAHNSIRFSIGRFTTPGEIDYAVEQVLKAVRELRELTPAELIERETTDWTRPEEIETHLPLAEL
jgi:cysteine desulfurase